MSNIVTYYQGGYIPAAPQQNRASLADGTASTFTTWDTAGVQTSTRPLTAAEIAQLAAMDAAATNDGNKATLQSRAQAALTANATFLALAAPTNVQTLAQVQLLTKESTALIRLALGLLDSTAGT